ncbi:MAG: chemotaxis protein CheW [Syntrophomonadaceae bacterium]|nr:chemotaxis protein CheW [Syntrophomonadaceae bacterium]
MEAAQGKYLTFLLNQEEYGIPIRDVKEIIGILDITGIPKTPKFLKGVMNLRGKIIPVIDLRLKFGMDEREYTRKTCIIVVEVLTQKVKRLMGVIVDTVSEVIGIHGEDIEPTSAEDNYFDEEFFMGLAKVKGKVIILLDAAKILNRQELSLLKN